MKKIIGLVLIGIIILSGCQQPVESSPTGSHIDNFQEPTGELATKTWISPGIVEISNFYAGAEADWKIRIHNGGDKPSVFKVTYRLPDNNREGYSMPPVSTQLWVTIAEPSPLIQSGETKEVLVNLKMPSGKTAPDKWEFWISVVEDNGAMVQTEMCTRWLVSMK